jgi:hypothetical protein
MCVLIFSTTLSETFLILRRIQRYVIINVHQSSCKVLYRYSCHILKKFEFSRQIFEKCSNIRFHETSSSGSRVVPCGRTDGQADVMKLIIAFRNFAVAPQNANTQPQWIPPQIQKHNDFMHNAR